ncbi:MAG: Coenzyme F420 hydrogenase/dehydrogenase, beta subunit C-terminal domain [Butyrivibrio sp.]|nr:Coenzyme F420 hydrogenase/dehydrogenase, beta subunit C-terminal domain [Butyrivibrio sp.]
MQYRENIKSSNINNKRILEWKDNPIIIFGAGTWGDEAYSILTEYGFNVIGFSDNNEKKWGSEFRNKKVYAPKDIVEKSNNVRFVIAISSGAENVRTQLLKLGIKDEVILIYSYDIDVLLRGCEKEKWKYLSELPIPDIQEDYCMGCGSCVATCSTEAIKLLPDQYGYYKPVIDKEKCINCGGCERVCPAHNKVKRNNCEEPALYSFYAAKEETLKGSSSGAIFPVIAEEFINRDGVIVGAAWNADIKGEKSRVWDNGLYAEHTVVSNKDELTILYKSKYMQSYLGNIGAKVKTLLESGTKVLFSGCPCQVAGLYAFLAKEYDKLYTIDILCGNSPSSGFFQKYLSETFEEIPRSYTFRYKDDKWDWSTVRVVLQDGSEQIRHGIHEDQYQSIYHDHTMCPFHCQMCRYHSLPRMADLTIGDFWGYSQFDPEGCNPMGTSALLVNNDKGQELVNYIPSEKIGMLKQVPIKWLGNNGYIFHGKTNYCSKYRDRFYRAINWLTFSEAIAYARCSN